MGKRREIEPIIVVNVWLILRVNDICEIAAFLHEEISDLMKDRFLIAIEKLSRIGEVEKCEIPESECASWAWIVPPCIDCIWCQDYSLEDDLIDERMQSDECE